jgi:hypothetical protein
MGQPYKYSGTYGMGGSGGGLPPIPEMPNIFGGGGGTAKAKSSGALTQKGGKYYDASGQEYKLEGGKWVSTAGGGGGTTGSTFTSPNLQSIAKKDPRIEKTADILEALYAKRLGAEGQIDPYTKEGLDILKGRMDESNLRRVQENIAAEAADYAAGLGQRLSSQGARMGRGAGFGGEAAEAAGQRLAARGQAQAALAEQARQDMLAGQYQQASLAPFQQDLARMGLTQGAAGQMAGFAPTGAQLGLSQQQLGLQQWQAANQAAYQQALLQQQQQQSQLQAYLQMLAAAGY